MKINDNGVYREMTPEEERAVMAERAAYQSSHEPTVAELAQLLEQERQRGDQLQEQIDSLLEGRTG